MLKLDSEVLLFHQPPMNLYDLYIRHSILNRNASSAGLAIGTTANTAVKVGNTTPYTVHGEWLSKTTAEVAFTAITHDIPNSLTTVQERLYYITINAAGTLSIQPGTIATGAGQALYPDVPANSLTVLGAVRIAVAAGATKFTAGTDALNAGHLTVTYINLSTAKMPSFLLAI